MTVYDDKKVSNEDLRRITGVNISEEDQWEAAARDELKRREKAAVSPTSDTPDTEDDDLTERQRLKNEEERPKIGTPPDITNRMTPEQAKEFNSAIGLYTPGGQKRLRGLTFFQRHKKGIIGGGIGGTIAIAIISLVFFIFPTLKIPSVMGLITSVVGEAAEEIVENRAQRIVIGYLIRAAGGDPGDYVIQDSLLDTLWATFRTNRLEDKIAQQTGIRLVRGGDGIVRVTHDGRDMGSVQCGGRISHDRCVQEVLSILNSTPGSQRDVRKIVRLSVPAWRFIKASKMARYLRIKYGIPRFGAPKKDPTKTSQENLEILRRQQLGPHVTNSIRILDATFDCMFNNTGCETLDPNYQPDASDFSVPEDVRRAANRSAEQITNTMSEVADEVTDEVVKTGASFTETLVTRILTKLIGQTATQATLKSVPVVGWIDLAATITYGARTFISENYASRIPSLMTAASTGAIYATWLGYGDQIKAGKMDMLFVGALSAQLAGDKDSSMVASSAYKFLSGKDPSTGIPVEDRVNDNVTNPILEGISKAADLSKWVDPLFYWYRSVGALLRAASSLIDDLLDGPIGAAIEFLINSTIGQERLQELVTSSVQLILKMASVTVDPLARGAKMFNQLYTGAEASIQDYTKTYLGGRATSSMIEVGPGASNDNRVINNSTSYLGPTVDDQLDLAALPLGDRLFSLDEPHSLVNTIIRSLPARADPAGQIGSIFRQLASLPTNLFSIFTSKAKASHIDPELKASIAGVRQYGATPEDLNQDIAAEVRTQADPVCPENNPEEYFNVCQADKEVIGSLMCIYTDCPEFTVGGIERPSETNGLVANLKQLWQYTNDNIGVGVWR